MKIEDLELKIAEKVGIRQAAREKLVDGVKVMGLKTADIELLEQTVKQETVNINQLQVQLEVAKGEQEERVSKTKQTGVDKMLTDKKQKTDNFIGKFIQRAVGGSTVIMQEETPIEGITTDGKKLILKEGKEFKLENEGITDLAKLFLEETVTAPSGTIVLDTQTDESAYTVEELKANPQIADLTFTEVDYKVSTYRRVATLSKELVLGSAFNISSYVKRKLSSIKRNTGNRLVVEALKTLPTKPITNADDLDTLVTTGIEVEKEGRFIVTQSASAELGKLKYADGRPIYVPDQTQPNTFKIRGVEVVVVPDKLVGVVGNTSGFYAAKDVLVTLNFHENEVAWEDHSTFSENFAFTILKQVKVLDNTLGFQLLFDVDVATEPEV